MMMYKLALFFACVGVMSGMVNGIMGEGDNWFEQETTNMTLVAISESQVEDLSFDSNSGIIDQVQGVVKYGSIFFSILEGVFLITAMLSDVFVYDVDGNNLFKPILILMQLLIYFVYISGVVQFVTNRSFRGPE
ncbi:MAG: hypothetical protein KAJ03_07325 [Gammaproteobacteria bacterium]|nr:hypothetical protein [Gammaproteobacteria bacterium]